MKLTTAVLLVSVLASPVGARAQESEAQPSESPRPRMATPLKLNVLFQRFQGETQVASLPYTLSLSADERPARLRMGVQVPILVEGKEARVQYQSVGSNLDCQAEALDGGRFSVACVLEYSSLYSPDGARADLPAGTPLSPSALRSFRADSRVVLRDGQTGQFTTATDPVSGEQLKIEVTLKVVK